MEEKKTKGNRTTIILVIIMILLLGTTVYLYVQNQKINQETATTVYEGATTDKKESSIVENSKNIASDLVREKEEKIKELEDKIANLQVKDNSSKTKIQLLESELIDYVKDNTLKGFASTNPEIFSESSGYKIDEVVVNEIGIYSETYCKFIGRDAEYNIIKEDIKNGNLKEGDIVGLVNYTVKFNKALPKNMVLAGSGRKNRRRVFYR